jgi:hypothetical protein
LRIHSLSSTILLVKKILILKKKKKNHSNKIKLIKIKSKRKEIIFLEFIILKLD